ADAEHHGCTSASGMGTHGAATDGRVPAGGRRGRRNGRGPLPRESDAVFARTLFQGDGPDGRVDDRAPVELAGQCGGALTSMPFMACSMSLKPGSAGGDAWATAMDEWRGRSAGSTSSSNLANIVTMTRL